MVGRNSHPPQPYCYRRGVLPQVFPIAVARKPQHCPSSQHPKSIFVWRRREVVSGTFVAGYSSWEGGSYPHRATHVQSVFPVESDCSQFPGGERYFCSGLLVVVPGGRSSRGPRSTTVGPRRPGVRVWIPAFLESTVGPRHIRDISGSRNPLEGVLGVPAEIATSVGPGGSRDEWGSPCAGRGRRARRGRR